MPGYGSPAQRFRFIAGGIGITPILPMLALGAATRRGLVDGLRRPQSSTACRSSTRSARFGDRIEIRTDDVSGLPTATELLGDCPDGTTVYACGPAPMLTAIRAELAGRDDVELHFERFAAPPVVDGSAVHGLDRVDRPRRSRVGADETLLTALNARGRARAVLVPAGLLRYVSDPGAGRAPSTTATRCSPIRSGTRRHDADLRLAGRRRRRDLILDL